MEAEKVIFLKCEVGRKKATGGIGEREKVAMIEEKMIVMMMMVMMMTMWYDPNGLIDKNPGRNAN